MVRDLRPSCPVLPTTPRGWDGDALWHRLLAATSVVCHIYNYTVLCIIIETEFWSITQPYYMLCTWDTYQNDQQSFLIKVIKLIINHVIVMWHKWLPNKGLSPIWPPALLLRKRAKRGIETTVCGIFGPWKHLTQTDKQLSWTCPLYLSLCPSRENHMLGASTNSSTLDPDATAMYVYTAFVYLYRQAFKFMLHLPL